jgi:hypothetical protein
MNRQETELYTVECLVRAFTGAEACGSTICKIAEIGESIERSRTESLSDRQAARGIAIGWAPAGNATK